MNGNEITEQDAAEQIAELLREVKSSDVLNEIISNVKLRHRQLTALKMRHFQIGDDVKWKDRYGREHTGYIQRINKRSLSLRETDSPTKWRVSPSFVEVL